MFRRNWLSPARQPIGWLASRCPRQGSYTITITATDAAGNSHSYTETFDNFSQNNFTIEAEDFDFNGGQFIDNPVPTGPIHGVSLALQRTVITCILGLIRPMQPIWHGFDNVTNDTGETFIYRSE